MPATIPKTWKKTPQEKELLWGTLYSLTRQLDIAVYQQRLDHVNCLLTDFKSKVKQIERAQVADVLDKV